MTKGIHHITAIAGPPQDNLDFYTRILGLRFVKRTVNFDDPYTYHLYYGDAIGHPGGVLTFFPWSNIKKGKNGLGLATVTGFIIPEGSIDFWMEHFAQHAWDFDPPAERFGKPYLRIVDNDGMFIDLVESAPPENYKHWEQSPIYEDHAIRGFHHSNLMVRDSDKTARVLTDLLGFDLQGQESEILRFSHNSNDSGQIIDIQQDESSASPGRMGKGIIHHIAFRVPDEDSQSEIREKILEAGHNPTPVIDRQYFKSVYFREPNGILFEIATDEPGFLIDEEEAHLGESLRLPEWHESRREEIEQRLPDLKMSNRLVQN
ncbi:MAG: ring-cleaving dioxygenase [Candidatus Marinimicrobia bacterium]|nr:ring-cleaving dioxygenase [Candidatus Neomarinimicrobiota bacterium]